MSSFNATTVAKGRKQRVQRDLLSIVRQGAMVVESVLEWRSTLWRPFPFKYNGMNYLQKVRIFIEYQRHT